jgi:PhzF family phenazine biosynthesis protein
MNYLVIDAFTSRPFAGNPAAVVWLDEPQAVDDARLAAIAAEFNLSETAFVSERGDGAFDLRWFTPAVEVDLCGHATLAAAAALWHWDRVAADAPIRFVTRRSGELVCRRDGEAITIDLPATPPQPCPAPADVEAILGVPGPVHCAGTSAMNLTLVVPDETQVLAARPDMRALEGWHETGVIVTATCAREGVDFVSRFFAPAAGVPEDPVTGSAHCASGPYWAGVLGKETLVAEQLSKRGGRLGVCVRGDRVELTGESVVVMSGATLVREAV